MELLDWMSWPPRYVACGRGAALLVDPGEWPSEWLTNYDLKPRCSHSASGERCCSSCFRACVRDAVRFRFEGDSDERQRWLQLRRQEMQMEAAAEQERKAAEAAATAAARAAADAARAEERVREAERNRLEQQEKQRLHDPECARVAAAASEAGRPRISAANAADWEQPQLEARGADGECLYLIEERQYYGLRRQLGSYRNTNGFLLEHYLTHEQFCALPPSEQVLCRGYECKHKSQYPKCRLHCRCDGYELRDITRQVPDGRKVVLRTEIKYDCLWRKIRGHPIAIDLSAAVLWYWQMTGDVWYSSTAA